MGRPKELDPRASLASALGAKVRKLRERKGWTQQQLADAVFVSHSRIAQIELASDPPNEPLSALLDTALDADDDINIAYYHMAREGIRDWAQPYTNMEARASRINMYNPQLIPGIFQTRAYARALMLVSQPEISQQALERQVEGRLIRRRILEGPEPLNYWSILDESVLARRFGDDPVIMREQLGDLLIMAQRPNITLQVLPFEAGHHGLMDGSVTLLSFPDGPDAAYLEGADAAGQLVESTRAVTRYARIYSHLQLMSLPPAASLDLIRTTMEERYPCPPPLRSQN
jgi:transcriptional regulator with XRE-family HTH domain